MKTCSLRSGPALLAATSAPASGIRTCAVAAAGENTTSVPATAGGSANGEPQPTAPTTASTTSAAVAVDHDFPPQGKITTNNN